MKVIVGIDPGVTTGIAVVDMKLNVVLVESKRRFGKGEIVKKIAEIGDPIIVACDVKNPPSLVRKIAGAFNARIISPDEDLRIKKKIRLVRESGIMVKNRHERDSLAAALFAGKKIRALVERIERIAGENSELIEDILIRRRKGNIKQLVNSNH